MIHFDLYAPSLGNCGGVVTKKVQSYDRLSEALRAARNYAGYSVRIDAVLNINDIELYPRIAEHKHALKHRSDNAYLSFTRYFDGAFRLDGEGATIQYMTANQ